MNYKISPLNIIGFGALILVLVEMVKVQSKTEWYTPAAIILISFCIGILVVDFFIQLISNSYKRTLQIEIPLLVVVGLIYLSNQRTEYFMLHQVPDKPVTIVYGVSDTDKLPYSKYSIKGNLDIPENGILLTSSNSKQKLPKTRILLIDDLKEKYPNFGFTRFINDEIRVKDKLYNIRSWHLQTENCCMYSTNDIDKHKEEIVNYLKMNPADNK